MAGVAIAEPNPALACQEETPCWAPLVPCLRQGLVETPLCFRGVGEPVKNFKNSRQKQSPRLFFAAISVGGLSQVKDIEVKNASKAVEIEETIVIKKVINPSWKQLLAHPVAFMNYIPNDLALFVAGAIAGAAAKTVTAPLDRVKLLMQVHGLRAPVEGAKKSIGFIEALVKIGQDDGITGYWKGNLPQVIRVVPYSAVQLLAYEMYKKLFKGDDKELSVVNRLAAGACAGMTSTLVTYPLDVLRLRLAVDPASKTMTQVALNIVREEGLLSFYRGLGPSLIGIAPYIALNFCAFDLIKKALPEDIRKRPESSFVTALMSATFATVMCYPLDTVRRQMQMKGTPFHTVLDAFPGIIARDGVVGLYRGFVPNALKNLPNSSIRLTTFDAAKNLIKAGQIEFQRILKQNQDRLVKTD